MAVAKVNLVARGRHPYVVGPRPMKGPGGVMMQPGDPVPGAEKWPRVEAWVRARRIVPAPV